jgi:hypothetical protein
MPLPGIETRFLASLVRNLVTLPTTILKVVIVYYQTLSLIGPVSKINPTILSAVPGPPTNSDRHVIGQCLMLVSPKFLTSNSLLLKLKDKIFSEKNLDQIAEIQDNNLDC